MERATRVQSRCGLRSRRTISREAVDQANRTVHGYLFVLVLAVGGEGAVFSPRRCGTQRKISVAVRGSHPSKTAKGEAASVVVTQVNPALRNSVNEPPRY